LGYFLCSMDRASYNMAIIIQQDATEYTLFKSVNCSTCFGWYFTHHQELITLYLQYLALTRPVLQPVVNVAGRPATFTTGSNTGLVNVRYCRYSAMSSWCWAVDRFKYKLYSVVSCLIIIATSLGQFSIWPIIKNSRLWLWNLQIRIFTQAVQSHFLFFFKSKYDTTVSWNAVFQTHVTTKWEEQHTFQLCCLSRRWRALLGVLKTPRWTAGLKRSSNDYGIPTRRIMRHAVKVPRLQPRYNVCSSIACYRLITFMLRNLRPGVTSTNWLRLHRTEGVLFARDWYLFL